MLRNEYDSGISFNEQSHSTVLYDRKMIYSVMQKMRADFKQMSNIQFQNKQSVDQTDTEYFQDSVPEINYQSWYLSYTNKTKHCCHFIYRR